MSPAGPRITVVGAGVIGLTVAYELAAAGYRVKIVADRDAGDCVSGVAGALWYPYHIDSSAAALTQLARSLDRFRDLAGRTGTGVEMRTGLLIERREHTDRTWQRVIIDHPAADPADLPDGARAGFRLRLPLIDTPHYLRWLTDAGGSLGVERNRATVVDLDGLAGDCAAIVVAAGLRAAELLGDDASVYPVRGQVVRLANPGLRDWVVDTENPAGLAYVFPRSDDIVCGGTAEKGAWDTSWNSDTEQAILHRAAALVPEIAGLPVISRAVGLRPARPSVRLEVLDRWRVPVVTCYGHGGAGVSDSWGSAAAVHELVAAL